MAKLFVSFEYFNYPVDLSGNVYSSERKVKCGNHGGVRTVRRRKLKPFKRDGYLSVNIAGKIIPVHRLVLFARFGPPKPGQEARHLNDDRLDNRSANLRWGTREENMADAVRNKKILRGSQVHCAKLTEKAVRKIRAAKGKISQRKLADKYGVSQATIHYAMAGHNWTRV